MPPEILKQQQRAILEARKPGRETGSSADTSDSESNLSETVLEPSRTQAGGVEDARSHAETQTALRGISLATALRGNQVETTTSSSSQLSVATISRLLEQMEGGSVGGITTVPTVIFFTDNELGRAGRRQSQVGPRGRTGLTEPLLICDLPGQNLSSANNDQTLRGENQAADSLTMGRDSTSQLSSRPPSPEFEPGGAPQRDSGP